jgi:hypothetical protein
LGCGYELNAIRRGYGLSRRLSNQIQPIGTIESVKEEAQKVLNDVFVDAEKKEGLRARVEKVKRRLLETWSDAKEENRKISDEGIVEIESARRDLERFIQIYLPRN